MKNVLTKPKLWLYALFFIFGIPAQATHLTGGFISYEPLGNNEYEITLFSYVRCPVTLGNTGYLKVTNNCTGQSISLSAPLVEHGFNKPPCDGELSVCQGGTVPNLGYYIYKTKVFLLGCNDFTISNLSNARTGSINNITGNNSAYIETRIYDVGTTNPNKGIELHPLIGFAYINQPTTFQGGAFQEYGNHNLSYNLVCARVSETINAPYIAPYTCNNQLDNMVFNSSTGVISFTPNSLGHYVLTYEITEKDNSGNLIAKYHREIQLIVTVPVPPSEYGFENGSIMPEERNQLSLASPWFAGTGTPDLFDQGQTNCANICGTSPLDINCVGIPCNHFGNESIRPGSIGQRYAGVWMAISKADNPRLNIAVSGSSAPDALEFFVEAVERPITKLVPNRTYQLTFYVSKAEKGEVDNLVVQDDAHFQVKFSEGPVQSNGIALGVPSWDPVDADVYYTGKTTTSVGWDKVEFFFVPKKAYDHIIIESHFNQELTSRVKAILSDPLGTNHGLESYMYVDDIKVKAKPCIDPLEVDLFGSGAAFCGPVTPPCNGFRPVFVISHPNISGGTPPYTYSWSPRYGLSDYDIERPDVCNLSQTTEYTLTVSDANGLQASDKVTVYISKGLNANAGPDKNGCPGGSVTLNGSATGGLAPYNYSWSPSGGSNANATVPVSGDQLYTLTVSDNAGCTSSDQVWVRQTGYQGEHVRNDKFESGTIPELPGEFGSRVSNWIEATGTPDLFDNRFDCAPLGPLSPICMDVPNNYYGNQPDGSNGRRYGGLSAVVGTVPNHNGKYSTYIAVEGIETQLNTPIDPNKYYRMSLKVSRAEYQNGRGQYHALLDDAAHFTVKFSQNQVTSDNFEVVPGHLVYEGETNSTNSHWQEISFNFRGNRNYRYLIIQSHIPEDLRNLLASMQLANPTEAVAEHESYMYIDEISIQELCTVPSTFHTIEDFASKSSDETLTNIEVDKNETMYHFYPNPASNQFTVDGLQVGDQIVLSNLLGEQIDISSITYSEGQAKIPVSNLQQGVYLVTVINQGKRIHQSKMTVIH